MVLPSVVRTRNPELIGGAEEAVRQAGGSLMLGIRHGAYCVGCCWMLMALLFVGGVMNLVWIAILTLLIMAEKLVARGEWISRGSALALLAWAAATLLV